MNYGLALSGGGTRGAAHVGVLLALEEEHLLPTAIAGTSAGSIVAGIYGAGMKPSEMKDVVHDLTRYGHALIDPDYINILRTLPQLLSGRSMSLTGLIKGNRLNNYLCKLTEGISITAAPMPIVISAVDINSGGTIAFTNASRVSPRPGVIWNHSVVLCDAMMASSSVPGIFRPRFIENYCLVDGGVTNNLPVDLLIAAGVPNVIAVDIGVDYQTPHSDSISEVVSHSFSIMSFALKECQSLGEILSLKPKLPKGAGLLTFEQMDACMEAGYHDTKRMMPAIRRKLLAVARRPDYGKADRTQSIVPHSTDSDSHTGVLRIL